MGIDEIRMVGRVERVRRLEDLWWRAQLIESIQQEWDLAGYGKDFQQMLDQPARPTDDQG